MNKNGRMKQVDRIGRMIERRAEPIKVFSRQPRFGDTRRMFNSILNWIRIADLEEPPYSPDSRRRDKFLSTIWRRDPHLAGVVHAVVSIDKNRGWSLVGGRNQVLTFEQILKGYDGEGWRYGMTRSSTSFYTTDIGAIIEIGRDGINGPMRGLYHVDSTRCKLTGDAETPLMYYPAQDKEMGFRPLDYFRIVSMPNTDETYHGLGYCLSRDSTVMMADGTQRRIIDLIETQSTELVMSVAEDGSLVARPIIGWYKNPLGGRRLINIRGRYSQFNRGSKSKNSWVTEDHPILTPDGYVKARDLVDGDKIVTAYPSPNKKQREFLVGAILGDAHVSRPRNRARFSMGHCLEQYEWFELKAGLLTDFGWSTNRVWNNQVFGQTSFQPGLIEWREWFYPNGKKCVPRQLVEENFTPLMLVTWYLDDGNIESRGSNPRNRRPAATFTTVGLSVDDVVWLADLLTEHGYEARVVSARKGKKNIRLTADGSAAFFEAIAPYVPPTMRYKIPEGLSEFDKALWDLGQADRFVDELILKPTGKPPRMSHVYCIDVAETHNFITAGIVVHNCAISRALEFAKLMIGVYMHDQEQLGARAPRGLMLLQNISEEQWQQALESRDAELSAIGRKYFNGVMVLASEGVDQIDAKLIALSQLPRDFNMETTVNLIMFGYALVFGYDPAEFWPVQASVIGRTKESDSQERKATGKGGQNFILDFQEKIQAELPNTIHFEFDQRDAAAEQADATLKAQYIEMVSLAFEKGLIDREEGRSMLADFGVIDRDWTIMNEDELATDRALHNDRVMRAIDRFPAEPIVRLHYDPVNLKTRTDILYWPEQRPRSFWIKRGLNA